MFSAVQTVRKDGDNSMHSQTGMDGSWFVLDGRARFYGDGDALIAEIGQHKALSCHVTCLYGWRASLTRCWNVWQVEAIDKTARNKAVPTRRRRP